MTQNLTMALPVAANGIDHYIDQAAQIPVLSTEEEHRYAVQLKENGDLNAARTLILSNLRFVLHVARGYNGYGLPLADLVQEGNIGLMKAVKRFDPDKGVRLISFAVHWIRAEIHEFILRNWRIVKVATTKAQRKLFFNLRKSKKRLGWLNREEVETVANDLGVKPETVLEMESRLSGQDIAFDAPNGSDDDNSIVAPANYLPDLSHDPAKQIEQRDAITHQTERLHAGLSALDDRSRDILQQRWLQDDKVTLQELASKYQVSVERIRQVEKNAINKLKKQFAS